MIVCIGDSITAGQHVPRELAWPRLLTGPVHAAGMPGDTTRLGLERFPAEVQTHHPRIVVIQFGHNDANRWQTDGGLPRVSPAAFTANLREMVDRCRAFDALPILCTLTPSARSPEHAVDVEHYDRLLRGVANSESVRLADVRAAFDEPGLVMADGLHLTEAGHRVYASVVGAVL